MATKEITKQDSRYDLEPELVLEAEDASVSRERMLARLTLLWQERRFLLRCAAIGLILSTLIAFLIPVRYTSTTRLMPPDQAGSGAASMLALLSKTAGDMGSIGGDLLGLKTSGDLFVAVLHSRTVEDGVIGKLDLRKVYGHVSWEDTRKELESRMDVSADRKSGIITIKSTDRNPQRAADIGQEYVVQLNRVVTTLDTSAAHRERIFLESRLQEVQQDLESAEKEFSQFASKNTALDVKEQGIAMIGAAAQLEGELIAAQTQLQGLEQIYTANNVRVRSLQARVDEYRRQLKKLGGKVPAGTEGGPSENDGTVESSQDLYPSIRQLPILGVTWADLYRRTRVQEAVFEALTKQYERAKVEEAREVPSVKVLDVADVPERKSYPPRLLFMMLGTILMLIFCSLYLFGRARWREVDASDPVKLLAGEVMQTIKGAGNVWWNQSESRETRGKIFRILSRSRRGKSESSE
jgi:capsule polysaccharide export protein KpsE/RkpR